MAGPEAPFRQPVPRLLPVESTRRTGIINETTAQLDQEARNIKRRVLPGVVSLVTHSRDATSDAQEKVGIGTGFMIAPGVIATDRHVIDDFLRDPRQVLEVATSQLAPDGSMRDRQIFTRTQVLYADPQRDIAFVKIDLNEHPDIQLPVLDLGSIQEVEAGDRIMAFGSPWGLPDTLAIGTVAHDGFYTVEGKTRTIGVDDSVRPGMSGGPQVHVQTGRVIAVTEARLGEDEATGLATIADDVSDAWEKYQAQQRVAA